MGSSEELGAASVQSLPSSGAPPGEAGRPPRRAPGSPAAPAGHLLDDLSSRCSGSAAPSLSGADSGGSAPGVARMPSALSAADIVSPMRDFASEVAAEVGPLAWSGVHTSGKSRGTAKAQAAASVARGSPAGSLYCLAGPLARSASCRPADGSGRLPPLLALFVLKIFAAGSSPLLAQRSGPAGSSPTCLQSAVEADEERTFRHSFGPLRPSRAGEGGSGRAT